MPVIKDAEKAQIKSRARRYAQDLADAPLSSGLELYSDTISKLHDRSSRLRICLKCGAIDTIHDLNEDTHKCALDFNRFPVLVTTSWIEMSNFFLTDKYVKALQKIGVEPDVELEVEAVETASYPEISQVVSSSSKTKSKADSTDHTL